MHSKFIFVHCSGSNKSESILNRPTITMTILDFSEIFFQTAFLVACKKKSTFENPIWRTTGASLYVKALTIGYHLKLLKNGKFHHMPVLILASRNITRQNFKKIRDGHCENEFGADIMWIRP